MEGKIKEDKNSVSKIKDEGTEKTKTKDRNRKRDEKKKEKKYK